MKLNKVLYVLALSGSSVFAQSTVTLSGFIDASVMFESGGPLGSVKKVSSGGSGPSRFSFRGAEDLGDGLSASFVLESGFTADTGGSLQQNLFGRQSYLGLKGSAGNLTVGLQYTPLFITLRDVADPFRGTYAGNAGNLFSSGTTAGPRSIGFPNTNQANSTSAAGGINRANTAMYTTPNVNGFLGEVAYSFGEQPGDSDKLRTMGGSAGYYKGPLNARLSFSNTNDATGLNTARNTMLGANYDFGVAKAYVGFGTNKGYGTAKSTDYLIGVTVPAGPGYVMASYVGKNDKSPLNNDAHQVAVGYVYNLSKRTFLHASIGKISNTYANTSPNFYTLGTTAGAGSGDKLVGFGIGHFF